MSLFGYAMFESYGWLGILYGIGIIVLIGAVCFAALMLLGRSKH